MILELLVRDLESLDELGGRDDGVLLLAARCEQVGEQRLEQPEALGRDRPGRPLGGRIVARVRWTSRAGFDGAVPRGSCAHAAQAVRDLAAEIGGLERIGTAVLAQHPGGEHRQARRTR